MEEMRIKSLEKRMENCERRVTEVHEGLLGTVTEPGGALGKLETVHKTMISIKDVVEEYKVDRAALKRVWVAAALIGSSGWLFAFVKQFFK